MEDAAAKVVALKAKRDAWMSQRSAAMERENMRNEAGELVALDGGGGDGKVNDDKVLDRITERITSRLREELRIEVPLPAAVLPGISHGSCHTSLRHPLSRIECLPGGNLTSTGGARDCVRSPSETPPVYCSAPHGSVTADGQRLR